MQDQISLWVKCLVSVNFCHCKMSILVYARHRLVYECIILVYECIISGYECLLLVYMSK